MESSDDSSDSHSSSCLSKDELFLDSIITRIMTAPMDKPRLATTAPVVSVSLSFDELTAVTRIASASLLQQKSLLRIEIPDSVIVVGDIHGQMRDLRMMMTTLGDPELQKYLFLGDYVDRGIQGLEVAVLLLCLQARHPSQVFLLRGNHEDCNTTATYGFFDECVVKYGKKGQIAWMSVIATFNCLPICALLGDKILCMHGGLSPHLRSLEDINTIVRPTIIPPYGLMCDLLWSDPESSAARGWSLSSRGISFSFDASVVHSMCRTLGIDLIVRAHQNTTDMFRCGYKLFAGGRLVTIFSAPNYLNMQSDAAVLKVDSNLVLRFIVFRPQRGDRRRAVQKDSSQVQIEAAAD